MTFYIGLDLSKRRTGCVVLDASGKVVVCQSLGATPTRRPANTLELRISYYAEIAARLNELLMPYALNSILAIESYVLHSPGDPTIGPELGGIVRYFLLPNHPGAIEVTPGQIKMLATGNGAAKKEQVIAGVLDKWAFDCANDDNIADAFCLARWAMGERPAPKVAKSKAKMGKLTMDLAPKVPKGKGKPESIDFSKLPF